MIERRGLLRFALLSVVAAVVTIGLKTAAYIITGSIGLLSDALESLANLVAALVALYALWVAARPPDEEHTYGHTKAEYFSSGFEGLLIVAAAVGIVVAAVRRLIEPLPIQDPALGLLINALASVVNLAVARVLLRVGKRHESITLEADAQHLMADVWTSLGVIAGVTAAVATGWHRLDPIVAIAVALNVLSLGVPATAALGVRAPGHVAARGDAGQDQGDPRLAQRGRRALPRAADPAGRGAPVHLLPHPGAGQLDGTAGTRPAGARSRSGSGRWYRTASWTPISSRSRTR